MGQLPRYAYGELTLDYTPEQGRVTVSVVINSDDPAHLCLSVADTGRGISPDDLPNIFDRFYRSGQMREKSRLGLGLAIAHKIMELHDSRIAIENTPDIGTTVSFRLPVYS